jgi:hypothetical protein
MSKPWEATLVIENGAGHYRGDRWLYAGPDLEVGFVSEEAPGGAKQWAIFLHAAPDMARALAEVEQALGEMGWHMDRGVRQRVREALTKAGVLP